MVLVDTSVWISLFRKKDKELGQLIWSLVAKNEAAICGQVWVEFIGGFRTDALRRKNQTMLEGFPFLKTSIAAYKHAAELLALYTSLGPGDAIIAATAINCSVPILTFDRGFHSLSSQGLAVYHR